MVLLGMFLMAGGAFMGSYTAVEGLLKHGMRRAYKEGYMDGKNGVPYPKKHR